jgi:hypothetical protein|tara:strand:- start:61222 stop:62112 length:891 start_codon:yes stop_codon:yes gene_type:complete
MKSITLKHYLFTTFLLLTTVFLQAQVGIGTLSPLNQLDVKVPGTGSDGINIQNDSFNTQLLTEGSGTFAMNNSSNSGSYNFRFANATRYIMTDDLIYPSVNATDNTVNGALDIGRFNAHFRRVYTRGIHTNDNDVDGGLRINIGSGGGTTADYNFSDFAFYPITNRRRNLGRSSNAWDNVYADDYVTVSDRREKKNIKTLNLGMNIITKINTYKYVYKNDNNNEEHFGFMAQELQKIVPELVAIGNDENKTLGISYSELIPILVNALKEQDDKIDNLEKVVLSIQKKLDIDTASMK